jgi:aminoglycoside 6-adenylyltransferase
MLDIIIAAAEKDGRVRAAYMHGSRADPNALKDKFSDYDIVYVVTEIDSFINDSEWLNNFGEIAYVFESYKNENLFFGKEINDLSRRYVWSALFKDGSHIDLMLEIIEEAMKHDRIKNKLKIVLLDKDGLFTEVPSANDEDDFVKKPDEGEYAACCSGFWWFLSNAAKGAARRQLPYAMDEFYSKNIMTLNRMIEWYIGVQTGFFFFF